MANIKAPITGTVWKIEVKVGEKVDHAVTGSGHDGDLPVDQSHWRVPFVCASMRET
jgi:hypothetical protein